MNKSEIKNEINGNVKCFNCDVGECQMHDMEAGGSCGYSWQYGSVTECPIGIKQYGKDPIINPVGTLGDFLDMLRSMRKDEDANMGVGPMVPEEPPVDMVNKPPHYIIESLGIEVREIIQALIKHNNIPAEIAYEYGCTLKYLMRCGKKGAMLEDFRKASNYLDEILCTLDPEEN